MPVTKYFAAKYWWSHCPNYFRDILRVMSPTKYSTVQYPTCKVTVQNPTCKASVIFYV